MPPSTPSLLLLEANYLQLRLINPRSMSLIFHILQNRRGLKPQMETEDSHLWAVAVAEVQL